MNPGFIWYWKRRYGTGEPRAGAYVHEAWGPSAWTRTASPRIDCSGRRMSSDSVFGSAGFGVRRPLRFLAERLQLDDRQVATLAKVLERLKLEREQAAVDLRRSAGEFADALEADDFDHAQIESAGERRLAAAQRVQAAVSKALRDLHGELNLEQREELARLIRSALIRF